LAGKGVEAEAACFLGFWREFVGEVDGAIFAGAEDTVVVDVVRTTGGDLLDIFSRV
jgi:hypothetical protein